MKTFCWVTLVQFLLEYIPQLILHFFFPIHLLTNILHTLFSQSLSLKVLENSKPTTNVTASIQALPMLVLEEHSVLTASEMLQNFNPWECFSPVMNRNFWLNLIKMISKATILHFVKLFADHSGLSALPVGCIAMESELRKKHTKLRRKKFW